MTQISPTPSDAAPTSAIPSIAVSKGKLAPNTAKPTEGPAALIVLGRDHAGKSHASWFDASEIKLARKAAGLMGMATISVATDELRDVASKLPHGRVFASGKAFVPFVKGRVYDQLVGHLSAAERERLAAVQESHKAIVEGPVEVATDWSKVKTGSLIVAWESEDDGWWLAVVVKVNSDDLFTLRWRDYPDMPTVVRKRKHIALLHPDFETV